jgi:hypothetical protein
VPAAAVATSSNIQGGAGVGAVVVSSGTVFQQQQPLATQGVGAVVVSSGIIAARAPKPTAQAAGI